MSEPAPSPGKLAALRSIAIGFVLVLSVLQALPGKAVKTAELMPLRRALGAEVSDAVRETSRFLVRMRALALSPFDRLYDELGLGQRWRLFTVRGRFTYRINIEALTEHDQAWKLLYRAHDVDVLGLSPELTYRRLRGIFDPHNKEDANAQYDAFVHWVSKRVLDVHPEYVGLRISMERLKLNSPAELTQVESVEHMNEVFRPGTP
ncbi:MAG TPA: hypothetical protein VFX59_28440 [Polyangiales bacterium]|nr:hypothetical protein [Polyangiales bacterium]